MPALEEAVPITCVPVKFELEIVTKDKLLAAGRVCGEAVITVHVAYGR